MDSNRTTDYWVYEAKKFDWIDRISADSIRLRIASSPSISSTCFLKEIKKHGDRVCSYNVEVVPKLKNEILDFLKHRSDLFNTERVDFDYVCFALYDGIQVRIPFQKDVTEEMIQTEFDKLNLVEDPAAVKFLNRNQDFAYQEIIPA